MRKWVLLLCYLCNVLMATPYMKRFWKPIIFKEEKEEAFDRNKLIPIEEGKYNYGNGLPEAPETVETIVTAGDVNADNASFVQQELSADNIIKYLKEKENHSVKQKKLNIDNIYITPVRKITIN